MHRMQHHLKNHRGHGRHRARRGAVGIAILTLLDEQPMHGYELIGALDERSGGRWTPSAGSIYPALKRLEDRGLITPLDDHDDSGTRRYELTDDGRTVVAERADDEVAPWDAHGLGGHGELRRAVGELSGPARQIGRYGSADQLTAAVDAVKEATAKLYRILADGPGDVDESES
jgi:DNA-binding PadR family transcriptional regulator